MGKDVLRLVLSSSKIPAEVGVWATSLGSQD